MARRIPSNAPASSSPAAMDRPRSRGSKGERSPFFRALEGLARGEGGGAVVATPLRPNGQERGSAGPREDLLEERRPSAAAAEERSDRDEAGDLAPFAPPPSVLGEGSFAFRTTPAPTAMEPTQKALAELAAIADHMVTSMSLGRRGADGHALKMKLDLGARGAVDVRLALLGGELEVTLAPDSLSRVDALSLAATVERELGVRVSLD